MSRYPVLIGLLAGGRQVIRDRRERVSAGCRELGEHADLPLFPKGDGLALSRILESMVAERRGPSTDSARARAWGDPEAFRR